MEGTSELMGRCIQAHGSMIWFMEKEIWWMPREQVMMVTGIKIDNMVTELKHGLMDPGLRENF